MQRITVFRATAITARLSATSISHQRLFIRQRLASRLRNDPRARIFVDDTPSGQHATDQGQHHEENDDQRALAVAVAIFPKALPTDLKASGMPFMAP
jgi:hypothetical protein